MPKKRSGKNKDKYNILAYLILIGFGILIVFLLISPSIPTENYEFCEKLKNFDKKNADKYTELKEQLKNLCDARKLNQAEQELGDLSVGFLKNLSIFDANWKNESIAKEYAKKIDGNYLEIRGKGVNSFNISDSVDSLYRTEVGNLSAELEIQNMNIKNITSSTKQLENENSTLTAKMKMMMDEEENKTKKLETLSLTYKQKKNESNNLESNLSLTKSEYEKVKNSFVDNLFPLLLIGIAIGGMTGFALSLKWKKEKSYWDAYSSSAKVNSPLKLATLLTVALLVTLLLYLFLSGKLELILTG